MGRSARREVAEGEEVETTFFLLEAAARPGETVRLSPEEAHHALRVLRLPSGAVVPATDGRGGRYRLRLGRDGPGCVAEVLTREEQRPASPRIEVGVGVGRRERLLWCVDKLTELEVARIVLLLSAAVQGRRSLAGDAGARLAARAGARAAAALKQSMGAHLPEITPPIELESWTAEPFPGISLLLALPAREEVPDPPAETGPAPATETRAAPVSLAGRLLASQERSPDIVAKGIRLAVGPEGGFLPEEERRLAAAGFDPVHLGRRRLRFETAAVVAVSQARAVCALGAAQPSSRLAAPTREVAWTS